MTQLETAIAALRDTLAGRLILPADAEYDAARTTVYAGLGKRPGVIVRVAGAADVQQAVNAARDHGLELAIRSGGHSNASHSTTEGGIVIDLRDMHRIDIDPATSTAWVETGATAKQVTAATLEHGLVVGFGDTGSVGVGGITLGGGVGYLSRQWGLTIDSLLAVELVTADGQLLTADETHNSELFWALRGGGGNFGVATRFKYQLHALPEFTGGMIALPATPENLAGFIAAANAAPDTLSTIANVMTAPPMPFLPKEVVGKIIILAMVGFAGPAAAAEKALAPFRALAKPYADFIKPGSYLDMMPPEDPDYHPTAAATTMLMNRVGLTEARTIIERLEQSDASFRVAQLRVLGGRVARVPADATAYAHRTAPIMVNLAAFYSSEDERPVRERWVEGFARTLTQEEIGAYVNFLGAEGPERVRAAYPPATWKRLAAVKLQYDPQNLFRLNQNVPPA